MTKPTLTFLMPSHSKFPVGGFKVVYEYANRFVQDGYHVNIIYPSAVSSKGESFQSKVKRIIRFVYYKFFQSYTPHHWFDLAKSVNTYWVPSLAQKHIPRLHNNTFVATSAQTAVCLHGYNDVEKKIYFIQGYEAWWDGEDSFLKTLELNLQKIVISPHLLRKVESRGQQAELILNGFDFDYFKKENPVEARDKFQIAMLYHLTPAKGSEDGLKALYLLKPKFPLLRVTLFGYPEKPGNLPDWITYHRSPNKALHNQIYNEAAIFVGASHSEGWGLTIGEAMICGAAVACTNIDGHNIMAKNEDTALLCDPGDYTTMADNISRLITEDELRFKISKSGNKNIQQYRWDNSYLMFKKLV